MYTCTSITITNKLRVLSKSSCPLVHVKKQESAASHTLILSTTECIENNTSTKACTTITDNSYQSCLHSTIKECTTITKHPPRNVLPQQSFADTRKQLSQPSPNTSYMQKYDILCLRKLHRFHNSIKHVKQTNKYRATLIPGQPKVTTKWCHNGALGEFTYTTRQKQSGLTAEAVSLEGGLFVRGQGFHGRQQLCAKTIPAQLQQHPLGFLPGFTALGFQNTFSQAVITV